MPYIAHLTGLKSLSLSFTIVTDAGMKHVVSLKSLEYLSTTAQVTDKGIAYVGQLTTLKYLGLFGPTPVTDAGLEHVGKLTSLEELALVGDRMSDAGLAHLTDKGVARLAALDQLVSLSIDSSNLTVAAVNSLKPLSHLKSLDMYRGLTHGNAVLDISTLTGLESLS
jgi:hypothetical protein